MLNEYSNLDIYINKDEEILYRKDLHCTKGGSDKVYIVLIVQMKESNAPYRVIGLSGRRGNRLTVQPKSVESLWADAAKLANNIMYEKIKKFYNLVGSYVHTEQNESPLALNSSKLERVPITKWMYTSLTDVYMHLDDDDTVIEPYHELDTRSYVYATFGKVGWNIFDEKGKFLKFIEDKTSTPLYNVTSEDIYIGYRIEDRIALADVCYIEDSRKPVSEYSWKARRAMLTHNYGKLFPDRDPFENDAEVYLNDYISENKSDYVSKNHGAYIARSMNARLDEGVRTFII